MRGHLTVSGSVLAVTAAFVLSACGDGGSRATPARTPATLDASPPISAVTEDYSPNGRRYLGRFVTLTGEVTRVLTRTAFVLTGQEFDEDSLLVLSLRDPSVRAGTRVTVTGEVQRFRFTSFDRDYRLPYESDFAASGGQEFLIARDIAAISQNSMH